jgi:hypothetical protein
MQASRRKWCSQVTQESACPVKRECLTLEAYDGLIQEEDSTKAIVIMDSRLE